MELELSSSYTLLYLRYLYICSLGTNPTIIKFCGCSSVYTYLLTHQTMLHQHIVLIPSTSSKIINLGFKLELQNVKLHLAIRFSFVNSSRYSYVSNFELWLNQIFSAQACVLRPESWTSIIYYIISARQNQKFSRFDQSKKRMQLNKKWAQFLT